MVDVLRLLTMRHPQRPILLLLLLLSAAALAQPQLQPPQLKDAEFESASLGRPMKYRILLPSSYAESEKHYPVLYLLHGLTGNYRDWTDKTPLQKYVAGLDLIIVMPDADDSWYTNWDSDPKQKFEDHIIRDLRAEIETRYRTIATRETRYIAGLSMGGYGALKYALKYPELFSVAGSFSGALNAATDLGKERRDFNTQLVRVFGGKRSRTRKDNSILNLIRQAKPDSLPTLYLTCGSNDYLLDASRETVAALSAAKISYDYHESPGAHTWDFWDRSIREFLRHISR
jgi:S-formylglutathione hydrolase FrmB